MWTSAQSEARLVSGVLAMAVIAISYGAPFSADIRITIALIGAFLTGVVVMRMRQRTDRLEAEAMEADARDREEEQLREQDGELA